MRKKYQKPKVKASRIQLNFFLTQSRFFDSFDPLADNKIAALIECSSCSSCGCGCCFLRGTKVIMADRYSKEIQDIKSGDWIYSYNHKIKKFVKNKVDKLLIHPDIVGGYYIINGTMKVTGNHRIWVNNSVWERVENLKIGDFLMNSERKKIRIFSIEKVKGTNTIYNLHINGEEHNYFAESALVHNAKTP